MVTIPRVGDLMATTPGYVQGIARAAKQAGVSPVLALAIALEESGGRANAVGDQGTSFGAYQLHQGGALGRLTPQQAFDPYTNAMAVLPAWAKAGGGKGLAPAAALMQYYSRVGRGSSNTIPTQHALALIPQAQRLLGQSGTAVPAVGAQQPNATAASTPTGSTGGGISPALMAGIQHYLAQSSRQAAAGQYGGNLMDSPLFKQLLQARTAAMGAPAASGIPAKTTGASPMAGGGSTYQTPFGTTFTAPSLPGFVQPLDPTSYITTPKGQRVGIVDFQGKPVNAELASLLSFAQKHGWTGTVNSGYRSVAQQQAIYDATPVSRRGKYVAKPGSSPHNYAEAVDLTQGPQLEQIIRQFKLPISRYAPEGWHYELSGFRPPAYNPLSFT